MPKGRTRKRTGSRCSAMARAVTMETSCSGDSPPKRRPTLRCSFMGPLYLQPTRMAHCDTPDRPQCARLIPHPSGVPVRSAIYPGSFDPVTLGHWDLIQRAAMLEELTASLPQVEVTTFHGLLVDFAKAQNAQFIIRGVRAFSDFEYEFQMALMNRKLAPELETVFLMPKEKYSAVSSRFVREIGSMGGNLTDLVPDMLRERIAERLKQG